MLEMRAQLASIPLARDAEEVNGVVSVCYIYIYGTYLIVSVASGILYKAVV
jgi:hypothetical protein